MARPHAINDDTPAKATSVRFGEEMRAYLGGLDNASEFVREACAEKKERNEVAEEYETLVAAVTSALDSMLYWSPEELYRQMHTRLRPLVTSIKETPND